MTLAKRRRITEGNGQAVCVFCSSSDAVDAIYGEAAAAFGAQLPTYAGQLVYGGVRLGLMGILARAVHASGGQVIGVIPQSINARGIAYEEADELVVTRNMAERKRVMAQRASAFVVLPGGLGTFEELFEVLTLKQLHYHSKPIALLNTGDFFAPFLNMIRAIIAHRFAKPAIKDLYHVAADTTSVFDYLERYAPPPREEKWF